MAAAVCQGGKPRASWATWMHSRSVAPSVTGTLTQNEMVFKRLHLGTVSYGTDTMDEIQSHVRSSYAQVSRQTSCDPPGAGLHSSKLLPLLQSMSVSLVLIYKSSGRLGTSFK